MVCGEIKSKYKCNLFLFSEFDDYEQIDIHDLGHVTVRVFTKAVLITACRTDHLPYLVKAISSPDTEL